MRCWGRTKKFSRCNRTQRGPFCHLHGRLLVSIFVVSSGIAVYAGLYRDLIEPLLGFGEVVKYEDGRNLPDGPELDRNVDSTASGSSGVDDSGSRAEPGHSKFPSEKLTAGEVEKASRGELSLVVRVPTSFAGQDVSVRINQDFTVQAGVDSNGELHLWVPDAVVPSKDIEITVEFSNERSATRTIEVADRASSHFLEITEEDIATSHGQQLKAATTPGISPPIDLEEKNTKAKKGGASLGAKKDEAAKAPVSLATAYVWGFNVHEEDDYELGEFLALQLEKIIKGTGEFALLSRSSVYPDIRVGSRVETLAEIDEGFLNILIEEGVTRVFIGELLPNEDDLRVALWWQEPGGERSSLASVVMARDEVFSAADRGGKMQELVEMSIKPGKEGEQKQEVERDTYRKLFDVARFSGDPFCRRAAAILLDSKSSFLQLLASGLADQMYRMGSKGSCRGQLEKICELEGRHPLCQEDS